jgi:hypothetical protein
MMVQAVKPQGVLSIPDALLTMLEMQVGVSVPTQSASELQGIPHAEALDEPQMGALPVGREKQATHLSGHCSAHVGSDGGAGAAAGIQTPL